MPSISSHKDTLPQLLPVLDEMPYNRRKVSVDPQLNFVNPVHRRGNFRNNLLSEQVANIEDLSNTYESSVKIGLALKTPQTHRLLESQQKNLSPITPYTQLLQVPNTTSLKPSGSAYQPFSVTVANQINPGKVTKELRNLNDYLDTQEIYFNENLSTSVAEQEAHTKLVLSIEKSYRKVIAKVLKQFPKNQVMDDIILLFKRAIKGLDSVSAQNRDFTKNIIEKLKDDNYKVLQAKEKVESEFKLFKQTETLDAYFSRFKVNPTREFRLEIINNVNMWLNGSNADAIDPMKQIDRNIYTQTSGVDRVLEMLSEVAPFEYAQAHDQLSFDDLEKDQEKFIKRQTEQIRKDALGVARVAENNTKKLLMLTGGRIPTMDHGTNTETWMQITHDFMDKIQQLEKQIKKKKQLIQSKAIEDKATIDSLKKDLKHSQELQSIIRQEAIESENRAAQIISTMQKSLGKDAVSTSAMIKKQKQLEEKNNELAALKNMLIQKNSAQQTTKSQINPDLQDPSQVTSSAEMKKGMPVNQDLSVVEVNQTMTKEEINDFVPVIQKIALVQQVFQANVNALKYKVFYDNLDKIVQAFKNVPFMLDQIFVLSQTKNQEVLKILNFGCVGDSQALKQVVERIFTKSKTTQMEGTNADCANIVMLNQITQDAAAFITYYNKVKDNKKADVKKKIQEKLQLVKKNVEKANDLFEKLPTEIGLDNNRLLFFEAQDCHQSLSNFFKENLAKKELDKKDLDKNMKAVQNLKEEFTVTIKLMTDAFATIMKTCNDCNDITKQFKRLSDCILQEKERQNKQKIEGQTTVDVEKSLASQASNESIQRTEEEAQPIFIQDDKGDSVEKEVQTEQQNKNNDSILSNPDLDGIISQGLIEKLTETIPELNQNMVVPLIQESVNQTIESLRNELNISAVSSSAPSKLPKVVSISKVLKKGEVKKEIKVKEIKVKEHNEAKETVTVNEDASVSAILEREGREKARIAEAVSRAIAEANAMHKAELARFKGFDEKDNCKSCGKPKIILTKEVHQSEMKPSKDVQVKPAAIVAANKLDKTKKQEDLAKYQTKESLISKGSGESKLIELVVQPPALIVSGDQEFEQDNISFSTQHLMNSTDKEKQVFESVLQEMNRVEPGFIQELDSLTPKNQNSFELDHPKILGVQSPQNEILVQKKAKFVPQKAEKKKIKILFQKTDFMGMSFMSNLDKDELTPQKTQNIATPFVHIKDENEGQELDTPSKSGIDFENLQGQYYIKPPVPKGHSLLLDQCTQTDNKRLLTEILVMINEAFFDNLQKIISVPEQDLQMTIDSFNKTMPQVYEQISSEANTFLVTNSVKYLNPSASVKSFANEQQEQVNKQRGFIALQDFSRYGQHTLELNQEIKERITVKNIGHIGGGFMGYQKR